MFPLAIGELRTPVSEDMPQALRSASGTVRQPRCRGSWRRAANHFRSAAQHGYRLVRPPGEAKKRFPLCVQLIPHEKIAVLPSPTCWLLTKHFVYCEIRRPVISSQDLDRITRRAESASGSGDSGIGHQDSGKLRKNSGRDHDSCRRQTINGPGLPENDMSIADNVQTAKTARCGLLDRAV